MANKPESNLEVLAERSYWMEKEQERLSAENGHLIRENKGQSKMIYIGFGLAVAVNFIAPFFGKMT